MMSLFRIAAAALALFLLAPSAGAQPLTKIRIGYPSISSRQAQLWIAKDEGLFRKSALHVELIFLRGAKVPVQALASAFPPLVPVGNVILANLQGSENVLV